MGYRDRLVKKSKIKAVSLMSDTPEEKYYSTQIPMMNIAASGSFDGGLSAGTIVIAGKSRHFKTLFGLILLKAWFDGHDDDPEATCIFYDTEKGASLDYFEMQGIDTSKVVRKYVSCLEDMIEDIANVLEETTKEDNLCFFWDSMGNVASRKEIKDALAGSEKADMTRAKVMKSLTRIVTIPMVIKEIPFIVIGHTYETMEMFSQTKLSGGTGIFYLADDIWFIGRQQDKDSKKQLSGWKFIINIEKSRSIKEKSKFPITVSFDKNGVGGVNKWSGLLEAAVGMGYVTKQKRKSNVYTRVCLIDNINVPDDVPDRDKEFLEKNTNNAVFWAPIFEYTRFKNHLENHYRLMPRPHPDDEEN